ncbi:WecB/TagA/CpsF family glycosyltransferase [Peptoniphilus catoniae]|uniref:WecB/TagA/CpsF family glycosyltransferase n=1 Tax=Peptoniphilus catoniae TaxID=1660341 RepID=UPI0010FE3B2D|nr:WecB/TagA/CpsF family glycosyltransferase [Peptoniphilus catoniae]
MDKVSIFGVNVLNISFKEAVERIKELLKEEKFHYIVTPNTEIVMDAKNNPKMKEILNNADMSVPDGIGLIYGSKIRNKPLKERVTGYDLSLEMLNICEKEGYSLYLLGTKPETVKKAYTSLKEQRPKLNLIGYNHGFFKGAHTNQAGHEEEIKVIEEINRLKPDIIFLGLGYPKQEIWIDTNKDKLNTRLIIGNGGVIDILSGDAKRAPDIFIKLNLEWFYRLITNPSRIKRQMAIPKFLAAVIFNKDSVK